MSEIKRGDLVMIVKLKPCCGIMSVKHGIPFIAGQNLDSCFCPVCCTDLFEPCVMSPNGGSIPKRVLKKIEPPSEGDSLPTRTELEVTA